MTLRPGLALERQRSDSNQEPALFGSVVLNSEDRSGPAGGSGLFTEELNRDLKGAIGTFQ